MGNFVTYLLLAVLIWFLFKINYILGFCILGLVVAYAIYAYIPRYFASQGNRAFNAGDFEGAVTAYRKCMKHRPKLNHRINYAYMLMRTGEFDEAEKVLDFILRFKTVKPEMRNEARRQRCMVYYKQGKLDEAIEEAELLYENGFKNSNIYAMLGYFKLVKAPASKETYNFCVEAYNYDSDNRDILDNMLLAHYHNGEYEQAKEVSDDIMSANPQFVEAYFHGAQVEIALGNYDKAAEYIEKIPSCRWSNMTTVTKEQVEALKIELDEKRNS